MKDFYYILGTARNASFAEIDAAYEKLSRKFYDEQDEFMDAHFSEIAEAYDVLRDTSRRRKYDAAFKRNQKKQLAVFKLKYINIAISVTFLVLTGLFALYVARSLHGHAAKKAAAKSSLQTSATPIFMHPKRHHKINAAAFKKPLTTKAIIQQAENKAPAPPAIVPVPNVKADSNDMAIIHANITGIVYLHESPDINSEVIAKIPDAANVRVLEKGPAWYKISYDDQTGYVLKTTIDKP